MFRKHHNRNGITSTASEDEDFGEMKKIKIFQIIQKIFLELTAQDRDPIADPAPQNHIVKCRITRNRKGIRGIQYYNALLLNILTEVYIVTTYPRLYITILFYLKYKNY